MPEPCIIDCNMVKKDAVKSFVLRVDAATMEALEMWAADEFRSVNGQLQWIIAEALRRSGRLRREKKNQKRQHDENAKQQEPSAAVDE